MLALAFFLPRFRIEAQSPRKWLKYVSRELLSVHLIGCKTWLARAPSAHAH